MAEGRSRILDTRYFGLIIGLIVVGVVSLFTFVEVGGRPSLVDQLEENVFLDTYFQLKEGFGVSQVQEGATISRDNPYVSDDILIIGIGSRALQRFGKWPFPRTVHASVVNGFSRIQEQRDRERLLFLDINFLEPDLEKPESDAILVEALRENGRVFLETFLFTDRSISQSEADEMVARQMVLIDNYGEIGLIQGDTSTVPLFPRLEAPLKPYGRSVRGYGSASFIQVGDNVFRHQILIARMPELLEVIPVMELSPGIELGQHERLEWRDTDGRANDLPWPMDEAQVADSIATIERRGLADGQGQRFVRRYRDHFIPSVALALALEYFNKTPADVEMILGEHVRIPDPQSFNLETQSWEPFRDPRPGRRNGRLISEILIPIDERGAMLINYAGGKSSLVGGNQTFTVRPYVGYARDPGSDPANWPRTRSVGNKILLTGVFASGLAADEKTTPFGLMYGVEVIANSLNTIIMNNFLVPVEDWVQALLLVFMVMLASFLASRPRLSTVWAILITAGVLIAYLITIIVLFDVLSRVLTFSGPAIGMLAALLSVVAYRVIGEEREKRRIQSTFGRFVSPDVVDEMLESGNPPELGGEDKVLTVFFSDIRGFTSISERIGSPQALINLLNVYLSSMTEIILKYEGTVDKYIGDAIMCFWGAPKPLEDHALRACKCALDQMKALEQLNNSGTFPEGQKIDIGIGLSTGKMTVGNMGSQLRMDYSLTGDFVNLGARLESANKAYKTNILMSEFTYGLVQDHVIAREIDVVRLKGKSQQIGVWELLELKDGA